MRKLALALAFLGCSPLPVGTDLSVRHFAKDGRFTTCVLHFNWTPEQTKESCGDPLRQVNRHGGGFCYVYENLSRSLRVENTPAPYMAVCFEEREGTMARDRTGKLQDVPPGMRLVDIIGLTRPE